jgi:hypothetical protein
MTHILVRKLLRDVKTGLVVVSLLLMAFQVLWARVSQRITDSGQILDSLRRVGISIDDIRATIFQGPGQILQALMGGENVRIEYAQDMISISYVHPLTQIILCVWAIGRASGAIAGEIDRGTMELLLAQPIRRGQVMLAHLCVDILTLPVLCLSIWVGTWLGSHFVGFIGHRLESLRVDRRQRPDDVGIVGRALSLARPGRRGAARPGPVPDQPYRPALGPRRTAAALHHLLLLSATADHSSP